MIAMEGLGAYTIGLDIDSRVLLGKDGADLHTNFAFYRLSGGAARILRIDSAHHDSLRCTAMVDAIVCDPPYGARAWSRTVDIDKVSACSSQCTLRRILTWIELP